MRQPQLWVVVTGVILVATSFSSSATIFPSTNNMIDNHEDVVGDETTEDTETIPVNNYRNLVKSREQLSDPEIPYIEDTSEVLEEESDTYQISVDYSFTTPFVEEMESEGTVYSRVVMSDVYYAGTPGTPDLPIKAASILLPPGTTVEEIRVTSSDAHDLGSGYLVIPVQEQVPTSEMPTASLYHPDKSIYSSETVFPGELYTVGGNQNFKGFHILILSLHPIQCIPATGKLLYYDHITVTVTVTLQKSEIKQSLIRSEKDLEDIRKKVDNPRIAIAYRAYMEDWADPVDDEEYDLVIITTGALKDGFEPLKTAHDADGIKTVIYLVEDIVSNPEYWVNGTWGDNNPDNPFCDGGLVGNFTRFNDTEAKIRNFIRHAYFNWSIRYVLLGGDIESVPSRFLYFGWTGQTGHRFGPSDFYYGCLHGSFNSDGDGWWGNQTDGQDIPGATGNDVDLFAEVYVGRACADNITEVGYFVNKTLAYMNADDEYLNQVLMVGQYLGSCAHYGPSFGANDLDQLLPLIPHGDFGYNIDTLYDRDWPTFNESDPCHTGWPKEELIGRINNGTHLIHHVAHAGADMLMKLWIHRDSNDVEYLTNDQYCFIYSIGCSPGAFDFPWETGFTDDCIGEYLTVKKEHGAFATILNSREGFFGTSHDFHQEYLDALFNENILVISEANQDSKEDRVEAIRTYYRDRWIAYGLTLFGDPTLSIKRPWIAEHNLSVKTVDAPNHVTLNKTVSVNATLLNYGKNDETNVVVSFRVDGVEMDTTTIPLFEQQTYQTVSFTWTTPVHAGVYTVTVNVTALDVIEDTYVDNERSALVRVGVLNTDTDELFDTIQDAIDDNDTMDDHEILVPSGTYYEQVQIDKGVVLIGENPATTIIDGMSGSSVIHVSNTDVKSLARFTIRNGTYGISMHSSQGIEIDMVRVDNTSSGLYIESSNTILVTNSKMQNNTNGIHITNHAVHITITENDVIGNHQGITIDTTENITISQNTIAQNTGEGILIASSNNTTLTNNTIYNNAQGTNLTNATNTNITENNIIKNHHGITINTHSAHNNITGNTICQNTGDGLHITAYTSNTRVTKNNVSDNNYGITINEDCHHNYIYYNEFNNTQNAFDSGSDNQWDNGYPSGGNYWSDYNGVDNYSGPGQNISGSDGIGDTPYEIPGGKSRDRYPWMYPFNPAYPVTNINTGEDFATIQEAIDDADTQDGHTIFVGSTTYFGTLYIDKALNLIGAHRETTILDALGAGTVVTIVADEVYLRGFTIRNGGIYPWVQNSGILIIANHTTITGNTISSNTDCGVYIEEGSFNTITGNSIQSCDYGIFMGAYSSEGNTISDNQFMASGIYIRSGGLSGWNTHTIENNYIDGYPLYYFKNSYDTTVPSDAAQVILANCSHVVIQNLRIQELDFGILVGFSSNISIIGNANTSIFLYKSSYCPVIANEMTNNMYGLWLFDSSNNTIADNLIASNAVFGIYMYSSSNNVITGNTIINNAEQGIRFEYSDNNTVTENNISTNSEMGFSVHFAVNNDISNNTFSGNTWHGLYVWGSSGITIVKNLFENNYIGIYFQGSNGQIIENTFINNRDGFGLVYSHWNNISGNLIANNSNAGMYLFYSTRNNITRNTIINNTQTGIGITDSRSNSISENTIAHNTNGIRVTRAYLGSANSTIYHNNFIGNTKQAYDQNRECQWDNGYPSGGNYWSNYNGVDNYSGPGQNISGSDGIGDTPYNIPGEYRWRVRPELAPPPDPPEPPPPGLLLSNNGDEAPYYPYTTDNYPLMEPWPIG